MYYYKELKNQIDNYNESIILPAITIPLALGWITCTVTEKMKEGKDKRRYINGLKKYEEDHKDIIPLSEMKHKKYKIGKNKEIDKVLIEYNSDKADVFEYNNRTVIISVYSGYEKLKISYIDETFKKYNDYYSARIALLYDTYIKGYDYWLKYEELVQGKRFEITDSMISNSKNILKREISKNDILKKFVKIIKSDINDDPYSIIIANCDVYRIGGGRGDEEYEKGDNAWRLLYKVCENINKKELKNEIYMLDVDGDWDDGCVMVVHNKNNIVKESVISEIYEFENNNIITKDERDYLLKIMG